MIKVRTLQQQMAKNKKRNTLLLCFMVAILLVLVMLTLCVGTNVYSLSTVFQVLSGKQLTGASFTIVTLRLPRLVVAIAAGFAFGMAGHVFQTMLRNPLASPDIIGVTSGTSAAAVFCILILQMSGPLVSLISIGAGLLLSFFIYLFSKEHGFSGNRMILIGLGIQAMMNAFISYVLVKANQQDAAAAMRWLSGSLTGMQMNKAWPFIIVVLLCSIILLMVQKHLRILELGEDMAIGLGLRPEGIRAICIVCAVSMIAFATSLCGPIAFIAFLSGPIARQVMGSHGSSMAASGMIGACLVLLADLIGQFAFSTRFPVGVITGMLGAPYLLLLLIRMNRNGGML